MEVSKFNKLAIETLTKKYESQKQEAIVNLYAYMHKDPVGIGEHPDLIEAVETQLQKISHAEDMLEAIRIVDEEYEISTKAVEDLINK